MHWTHISLLIELSMLLLNGLGNIKVLAEEEATFVKVHSLQGDIIGTTIPEGAMFKGIPFSQPPKGDYRWKNPRDPVTFTNNVWNATYYRPGCTQACTQDKLNLTCPETMDEDCLYLNVWVPTTVLEKSDADNDVIKGEHYVINKKYQEKSKESLAVMLFIHGGTFKFGAGSIKIYDGRFMSSQGGVIIVTINYRLAALGFLVQSGGEVEGNFAIYDQIAALKWVQRNIAFFGGNPNKVTIFGESAGAESVGTLLTTDASTGLFHQAIMESNPFALPYRNKTEAEIYGAKFAEKLNCKDGDMKCLRAASSEAVLKAMGEMMNFKFFGREKTIAFQPWSPVIDGKFLKEHPLFAFRAGRARKIPIILGTTMDEGLLFVKFLKKPLGNLIYGTALAYLFLFSKSDEVLDRYPFEKDNRYEVGKIITDFMFKAPNRAAAFGTTPQTWYYLFNQSVPIFNSGLCTGTKVCHTAELPYVFDTLKFMPDLFSDEEKVLGQRMVEYWTNFAKYGNPNGKNEESKIESNYNAISWPEFCPDGDHSNYKSIKIEAGGDTIITNELKDLSDFWDGMNLYGELK